MRETKSVSLGRTRLSVSLRGWNLTGAIKTAERKLADGPLRHGGQGLMSWAVSNARVEPKGNAILVTKQASGSAKIDPLVVAINAIALSSTNLWSCALQVSRRNVLMSTVGREARYDKGEPVAEMPRHSFHFLVGAGEEVAGMARPGVRADP